MQEQLRNQTWCAPGKAARRMKRLMLYIVLICLQQASIAGTHEHAHWYQEPLTYECPMHPEVKNDKPGKCPKCGMALVKRKQKSTPAPKLGPVSKPASETRSRAQNRSKAPVAPQPPTPKPVGDNRTDISPVINPLNSEKTEKAGRPVEAPGATHRPGKVRYDLYVKDTTVNNSGKTKRAIAINGSIPAPTLTFTEGDTAEIYVHNLMDKETSVHLHGVFLPNRFDGVPYLTQMPIKAHSTYLYTFPVIQNGTYWYHSHTKLQEQSGMYGALIFNKVNEPAIPTIPVVLSDWTDMSPKEVERSLHNATDWFAIKKGATQSYGEAISKGYFKTKVTNEWKRMTAMDVSDVYYEKFLTNGKPAIQYSRFKGGDKVKLRIVNGGASTYFWLTYSGGKISVVGNDGNDVQPVLVDRLIIAPAETYDLIVPIPNDMQYEFLATAEDRTMSTSLWLGNGMKMPTKPLGKLKYFEGMKMMNDMMKMNGDMEPMDMQMSNQQMDMNSVMYPESTGESYGRKRPVDEIIDMDSTLNTSPKVGAVKAEHNMEGAPGLDMPGHAHEPVTLNYGMLKAAEKTTLPPGPEKLLRFELTGNMNRYVWTIDNKTVSESDKILIKKGENVKIILYNNSMMRHPMHLHGHDFRVLNGQGEYAPLKNVLDIMPMETDTLEFAATESGDWFFHCHILYHMMSGMGRIFSYQNSPPNPEITDPKFARRKLFSDDRMPHFMSNIGLESNGSDGELMIANTRYRFATEWRIGIKAMHGNEMEAQFGRYFGKMQWFLPFVGFDYHVNREQNMEENNMFGQSSNQANRKTFTFGFQYKLPLLVVAESRIDTRGKLRFQLMREDIPVTNRMRLNLMGNTDNEYMAGLRYAVTRYFSLSTHYDSDMGYGAGITLTY